MPSPIIVAHRVLIGAAILFGVFFTATEIVRYRQSGRLEDAVVAAIAAVITFAMGYYLKNLRRFLGGPP